MCTGRALDDIAIYIFNNFALAPKYYPTFSQKRPCMNYQSDLCRKIHIKIVRSLLLFAYFAWVSVIAYRREEQLLFQQQLDDLNSKTSTSHLSVF